MSFFTTSSNHELLHVLNGVTPKVVTNPDGQVMVSQGTTTLDKVLSTVLSSLALIKGAGYVPTTAIPNNGGYQQQTQQAIDLQALQLLQQQQYNSGSTGANIEQFLRNNTGLLLVAGIGVVLLMSGRK